MFWRKKTPVLDFSPDQFNPKISGLTIREAKIRALELLQNSDNFTLTTQETPHLIPESAPSSLRELWEQYSRIEWQSVAWIDISEWIAVQDPLTGYFNIGTDLESPVLVKPHEELVYEFNFFRISSVYPSIYHWILDLTSED